MYKFLKSMHNFFIICISVNFLKTRHNSLLFLPVKNFAPVNFCWKLLVDNQSVLMVIMQSSIFGLLSHFFQQLVNNLSDLGYFALMPFVIPDRCYIPWRFNEWHNEVSVFIQWKWIKSLLEGWQGPNHASICLIKSNPFLNNLNHKNVLL